VYDQAVISGTVATGQADGSCGRKTPATGADETVAGCRSTTGATGRRMSSVRSAGVQRLAPSATSDHWTSSGQQTGRHHTAVWSKPQRQFSISTSNDSRNIFV